MASSFAAQFSSFTDSMASQSILGTCSSTTMVDNWADSDASSAMFSVGNGGRNGRGKEQKRQQNANKEVPKQKANFKCAKCGTNFKSDEMLELHHRNNCCRVRSLSVARRSSSTAMRFCSSPSDSLCDICHRSFRSPRGVHIHKSKSHNTKQCLSSSCSVCGYVAKYPSMLKIHKRSHSRPITATNNSKSGAKGCRRWVDVPSVLRQQNLHANDRRQGKAAKKSGETVLHIPKLQQHRQPVKLNAGTALVHNGGAQWAKNVGFEEEEGDENDDDAIVVVETKHSVVPRVNVEQQNGGTAAAVVPPPTGTGAPSPSAMFSPYAGMVISACAQSNLVTFHDVDTARGTIGKITFQFMCNGCHGQRGVARCLRGRAYCVLCCGHPECD